MVSTIATQSGYVAIIATQNRYVATLSGQKKFVRLCATQNVYVASLCDQKNCATLPDYKNIAILRNSKTKCCSFARPKLFARLRVEVCNLCFNRFDQKLYYVTVSAQARYILTDFTQAFYVSTKFDRPKTVRPSSTIKKNVLIESDQEIISNHKNLDRV